MFVKQKIQINVCREKYPDAWEIFEVMNWQQKQLLEFKLRKAFLATSTFKSMKLNQIQKPQDSAP